MLWLVSVLLGAQIILMIMSCMVLNVSTFTCGEKEYTVESLKFEVLGTRGFILKNLKFEL